MADLTIETAVRAAKKEVCWIAGVDEAGRGAWAGPVVAAAVILPLDDPPALAELALVNDSKQLTAVARQHLYTIIQQHALSWGIGFSDSQAIDQHGILPSTFQAMRLALANLNPIPDWILVDGRQIIPEFSESQQAVVRGDSHSLSIAAASILAKVARDAFMITAATEFPAYGFAQHKGYGTAQHRQALAAQGSCPLHRHSFAPLRALNAAQTDPETLTKALLNL